MYWSVLVDKVKLDEVEIFNWDLHGQEQSSHLPLEALLDTGTSYILLPPSVYHHFAAVKVNAISKLEA